MPTTPCFQLLSGLYPICVKARFVDEMNKIQETLLSVLLSLEQPSDDAFDAVEKAYVDSYAKKTFDRIGVQMNGALQVFASGASDYGALEVAWLEVLPKINLLKRLFPAIGENSDYPFSKFDLKAQAIVARFKRFEREVSRLICVSYSMI